MPKYTELPSIPIVQADDLLCIVDMSENVSCKVTFADFRAALDVIGGIVAIAAGGTGATTAQQALTNLGAAPVNHTHTASSVGADPVGTAAAAMVAHLAAEDPHPQYETAGEAQALVNAHASLTNNPHSVTAAQVGADAAGTASAAIVAHVGLSNPHSQYMTNAQIALLYAALSHAHVIGDVTGLQTALDGKAATAHLHAMSDVTGLSTALSGKSDTGHGHAISDVANLQTALDGKAASSHTQAISTITGLQTALDGKADTSHTQAISTITGLQTALDGKSATGHGHAISDVTGLQTTLDGKSATGHAHAIGDVTGLQTALDGKSATGHGHSIGDVTGLQTALDGKSATGHGHSIGDVTGLQTALDGKVATSLLGANSGVATLDADGKLTSTQLPGGVGNITGNGSASCVAYWSSNSQIAANQNFKYDPNSRFDLSITANSHTAALALTTYGGAAWDFSDESGSVFTASRALTTISSILKLGAVTNVSPADGQLWLDSGHVYCRTNGATVDLGAGGGVTGAGAAFHPAIWTNTSTLGYDTNFTYNSSDMFEFLISGVNENSGKSIQFTSGISGGGYFDFWCDGTYALNINATAVHAKIPSLQSGWLRFEDYSADPATLVDGMFWLKVGAMYCRSNGQTVRLDKPGNNIQRFTASGTWYKPDWVSDTTIVEVTIIAAGSGGNSGRKGAVDTTRSGGTPGAGGAKTRFRIKAGLLGATENVVIGTGGPGGAAVTTNDTNGNLGSAGGNSSFGSIVTVPGASPGATYTSAHVPGTGLLIDGAVSSSASYRVAGYEGCMGGGAGGAISNLNGVNNGIGGNRNRIFSSTSTTTTRGGNADGNPSDNGESGTDDPSMFSGQSGGGGRAGGVGHDGGNGGNAAPNSGAGGGGGGGGTNDVANSGKGGDGGDGYCVVICYRE